MSNPLSVVLNKLDSEWRCDDLSGEEATSAFRTVAMIAVAEHDAALVILQDTTPTDWEKRYRTLVQDLIGQQNCMTDREVVSSTMSLTRTANDFLAMLDDKEGTK